MSFSIHALGLSLILGAVGGRLWWLVSGRKRVAWVAPLITLFFIFLDWILMTSLRPLGFSFAPAQAVGFCFLLMAIFRMLWLLPIVPLAGWRRLSARILPRPRPTMSLTTHLAILLAVNLGILGLFLHGYLHGPFDLRTTQVNLTFADLSAEVPPLRIVHLSDTHVERTTAREKEIVRRVNELEPDLIMLTGDYLNLSYLRDETAIDDFRSLISQLKARYGIYAVRGSVDSLDPTATLFDGLEVVVLENESVRLDVHGQEVHIVGVACSHKLRIDYSRFDRALEGVPDDALTILLYHSPDLMEKAVDEGIDLYLAGHTHGGQIRLPFYGAILTGSIYGKQYEAGLYHEGETYLYVSRGLGMEGGSAPRVRFLCPPEIVIHTLQGGK